MDSKNFIKSQRSVVFEWKEKRTRMYFSLENITGLK